ncbi:hypothetical protein QTP88_012832 [Uroleucon formosanum]
MKENLTPKSPTSPQLKIRNRYTPLSNLNDNVEINDNTLADTNNTHSEVRKIPPIFVHNITNYEQFHLSLASVANDDFTIEQKKDTLKLKLTTIDDYRNVTKDLETMQIQYHTYQLPEDKRLSVVIRNLPVSILEETIFSALWELQYEAISVTRLQNYLKVPIPIVAVLLQQSSKHIYSLDRLLHCIVSVEPRKSSTDIPQCKNCQRYSHTEKYCHLPPRPAGGVAIIIRNNIKHNQLPIISDLRSLEVIAISLTINNKLITFISAYQSPSKPMYTKDYETIFSKNNNIILLGDLNSKHSNWGCTSTNSRGRKLQEYINTNSGVISAPPSPTYFPNDLHRQPDILDIVLLKGISVNITQVVLPELDSDHNPVKIILSTDTNARLPPRNKLINGKPNWCLFSNLITDNLQIPIKINSKSTADQAISHLTETITMAAQNCTESSQKRPTHTHTTSYSLPKKILILIQHKHSIRRLWQQYRRPEDRRLLNALTKQVRITLNNYRISAYKKYLSEIHPADPNLWRCTKRLLNKDQNNIPPLHTSTQSKAITDEDKCELFANTLASTFKPNDISSANLRLSKKQRING